MLEDLKIYFFEFYLFSFKLCKRLRFVDFYWSWKFMKIILGEGRKSFENCVCLIVMGQNSNKNCLKTADPEMESLLVASCDG